jgi:proton-translocating NADH-quinone oxidoreductase chain N
MISYILIVLFASIFLSIITKKYIIPIIGIILVFILIAFMGFFQEIIITRFGGWSPPFGIVWVVDKFSLLMGLLISGTCSLSAIYSIKYIRERKGNFYPALCLLTLGMLGVVFTGDIFNMYVFFEIFSISSYILVSFPLKKETAEASVKFLIMGALSTSFILLGVAMLYGLAGTVNIADLALKFRQENVFYIALGILMSGFFLKAAIFPFHFWLPDAHSVAPSSISALLSSVVVGTGVYAIMRVLFTIFGLSSFSIILICFGLITMILGGLMAFVQSDVKRLIAYSTISQTGYIIIAIGLGSNGLSAGIFHLLNNVIMKSLLFLSIGIVIWHTGTRDMNKLGGLGRQMPIVMISFLIGSLSIAGIPLLNGFVSKWMIYVATWEVNPLLTVVCLIVSAITLAYYMKAFSSIFLGPCRIKIKEKTPLCMIVPVLILTALCVIIGIFPQIITPVIDQAASALLDKSTYIKSVLG